nr:MAG TPA: hypothetical protein [Caudoviricetes sp.]
MYIVEISKCNDSQLSFKIVYSKNFDSAKDAIRHFRQKREEIKKKGYAYSFSGKHYYLGDGEKWETYRKPGDDTDMTLSLITC